MKTSPADPSINQTSGMRGIRYAILFALIGTLLSCAPKERPQYAWPHVQGVARTDSGREQLKPVGFEAPEDNRSEKVTQFIRGSGVFYSPPTNLPKVVKEDDDKFNLNFLNVDVRTVADAVLKDVLGRDYQVDPSIEASLSLQTSGPIDRASLLSIFEITLQAKGLAVVDADDVLHIVLQSAAPGRVISSSLSSQQNSHRIGFGVQVVPLKYAAPLQMRKLLQPFVPQGGILSVDEARNFLILAGTQQELASMVQMIQTFDIDWLAGMSFALFDIDYVEAETLAKELLQIFGDPESPIAGIVRFVPIQRLNAILAISPQEHYLSEVEQWIDRFDIGGTTTGRKIYVYHVKNGRSVDIASALRQVLGSEDSNDNSSALGRQDSHLSSQSNDNRTRENTADRGSTNSPFGANGLALAQGNNASSAIQSPAAFDVGGLKLVPNEKDNSLLIMATPSEFSVIEDALKQLDIPPRQVLIEATLIEVTLTDELRYGVQWLFESGNSSITQSQSAAGGAASVFPGFSYVFSRANDTRVVLNALESLTDVNVLFAPKLLVLNNQSATLQVGDQVPVPVQTAVSTGDNNAPIVNAIQFRDTGVILSVTPRINEGGLVLIDIEQEVSDVVQTTSSGIDAPTIQQRRISSSIAVKSGDTIALGGLIRENTSKSKSGVPILSRIPILGAAFGGHNNTLRRTELIVMITPRIARDANETGEIMQYLREQFQALKPANAN